MQTPTQEQIDTFAATLAEDDAAVFRDMVDKENWDMIAGHFPTFINGSEEGPKEKPASETSTTSEDLKSSITLDDQTEANTSNAASNDDGRA